MLTYLGAAVVICLALVQNGSALRCWSCSSDLDPSCMDHFNATRLLQQRSYFNQFNNNGHDSMPTLRECTNNLGQIYRQKQVCVKKVLTVPYGKKIVSRECKAVPETQMAGKCTDQVNNVEFCEMCEYDGCNGASGLNMNTALAVAVPATLILFFRR